ncbi:MAG: AI-2E family transporter [Gemmatimonadota bacterium]|nr:AI-2E family transporter [Gemmatimonadota bacterium]
MPGTDGGSGDTGELLPGPRLQKGFLILLVAAITILFLVMIRHFLVALILAGVFASMSRAAFLRLERRLGGKRRPAALLVVLALLLLIVAPLGGFLALVVSQAVDVAEAAGPWIREQSAGWQEWIALVREAPLVGSLIPEESQIASSATDVAGRVGSFLVSNLQAATRSTVTVMLQLFVMLYAMYFFLMDGGSILRRILHFTPLDEEDERRLIDQFVSVTRATIKGSILVGLIQGALAGAAFFVLALPGAAFWSTVMAVLSVIPVLGSGIVWGPTAVILISTGRVVAGIGLAVWGFVVVSTIDNFLRPRLVGRDTKMHDLLVLLSTFGGLAMFGVVGFIVGPIVAALFLTVWDLFGAAFRDLLPNTEESA